ncbi:MAG: SbcC/MukB-like Walker B domain-containing protein [Saccharospirillum sp.]
MRPLFLSIQAFGPFSQRQCIDFTELGDNALFLINGPTGSGKSSLLDAICFALYGVTTGGEREAASMRNDLAPDELETEVRLDVQLGDQVYCVRRQPAQEVAKKRGQGTTERQASAQVYKVAVADWVPDQDDRDTDLVSLKGVREVNDFVQQLTGLNADQFRQVMVLPQGKFRDLLLAPSSEREQIFSKLFQTDIFSKLEDSLQQQAAGLRREREGLVDKRQALLDLVGVATVTELDDRLDEWAPELALARQGLDEWLKKVSVAERNLDAGQRLAEQFKRLAELVQQTQAHQAQAETMAQARTRLQRARDAQRLEAMHSQVARSENRRRELAEAVQQAAQRERQLAQQQQAAEQTFHRAERDWNSLDGLKEQRQELRSVQSRLTELESSRSTLEKSQARQKAAQQALQAHQSEQQARQTQLQNLDDRIEQWRTELARVPQLEVQLATLDQYGKARAEWQKLQDKQQQLNTELQECGRKVAGLREQSKALDRALKETELAWHQGQAVELAQALELGQPCPVCGSTEHPNPAEDRTRAFASRADVDQARKALDTEQSRLREAQSEHDRLNLERVQSRQRAQEWLDELGDYRDRDLESMRDEWSQVNQQLKALKQTQQTLESSQRSRQQIDADLRQAAEQEASLRQALEAAIKEQASAEQALTSLEQAVPEPWRESGALTKKLAGLNQDIERIEQGYQNAQTTLQDLNKALASARASHTSAQQQHARGLADAEQARQGWEAALARSDFATEDDFLLARLTHADTTQLEQQLDDYQAQGHRLAAQREDLSTALEGQAKPDLDALQRELETKRAQQQQAEQQHQTLKAQVGELKKIQKELAQTQGRMDQLDQRYAVTGTLADVAAGRNVHKVSLQRFVLSVLLDDVLIEATRRLSVMSKGRYQLLRKQDRSKGNRASGLELEVEDAYTGKSRPVNTLSGGESFLAALALALGLSDVVQAYAGGIRLDTLFIDEGFGSLDPDSLDLAVQTLMELRANGRTIGIISHVSELKEQMPLRIDVTPSREGSTVKVMA